MLHFLGEVVMSPHRWKQHGPPKHWYPTTSPHDVISQLPWMLTIIWRGKRCRS